MHLGPTPGFSFTLIKETSQHDRDLDDAVPALTPLNNIGTLQQYELTNVKAPARCVGDVTGEGATARRTVDFLAERVIGYMRRQAAVCTSALVYLLG